MKLLITGASGMLGQDIVRMFSDANYDITATDRNQLDITDRDAVLFFVKKEQPDVIINTAAYNFVDKVEDDDAFPIAYAVNALGPRNLAEAAREAGSKFVHYSTDYVFSGDKPEGYVEHDQPQPISRYGETKHAGEQFVIDAGGDFYICRLSKIFGQPGAGEMCKESFVALMLRLAAEKPELKIVHEEVGTPGYTPDIAATTLAIIENNLAPGIYHVVNDGPGVTWFEFAEEVFNLAGVSTPRHPVTSAEFPKPAARPKFAALQNTKLPPLRSRREALREFLSTL
ncbi:MAG: dTDP-4-dehydrorhamnose reductase [bacterium]